LHAQQKVAEAKLRDLPLFTTMNEFFGLIVYLLSGINNAITKYEIMPILETKAFLKAL